MLYKYKASFISGALRALQSCEALACGASEVRKLGEEVEKSSAKLDDTIHTIAVYTAQNVHTQHAYRHCILVPVVESTCTCTAVLVCTCTIVVLFFTY